MSSVLLHTSKVQAARRFIADFLDDTANYHVYVAFGKDAGWTTTPPVPANTLETEGNFWAAVDNGGGLAKVQVSETTLVVPRINWTNGAIYTAYTQAGNTTAVDWDDPDHYVINSNEEVYVCTTAGGGASVNEPTGPADVDYTGSDGYYWTYLYTASYSYGLLTDTWMPVPDANAVAIGAHRVMIKRELPDSTGSGGILPASGAYNQVGIVINPQKSTAGGGGNFTSEYGIVGTGTTEVSSVLPVGSLIALDNRADISRNNAQSELIYMILSF